MRTAFQHVNRDVYNGFTFLDAAKKLFADGGDLAQHAAFTSGDQGRSNAVYGAVMWNQANVNTPLFGLLPKIDATGAPTNINDPRPQTFRTVFDPPQMRGPQEGGSWGEPVDFETREVKADPHHSQILFEGTIMQSIESDLQDDVPFDEITTHGEEYWQYRFETQGVARPVLGQNSNAPMEQYEDDGFITSIDRVVASSDEEANATDANGNQLTDGDLDVYTVDRSATGGGGSNQGGYFDSVVDHNGADADRQLTADLVNGTIEMLGENGVNEEDLVIVTGRDSARVMNELRAPQFRFDGSLSPSSDNAGRNTNGAETRYGVGTNTRLKDWDGIPIVEGKNIPSDSLSRVYFLDLSTMTHPDTQEEIPKIGIENYYGPIVETAGPGQETNTLAIDKLANQAGYLQTHELVCRRASHMGKLRDLAE